MNGNKRSLLILLIIVAMLVSFAAGFLSTMDGLAQATHLAELTSLSNAEWVVVQTSNFLLMGSYSLTMHMPLISR